MYIQRIDTLTSKDKEKALNDPKATYLIKDGSDFAFHSNSNLPITLQIIESIEVIHRFNLFLSKIDKDQLPTAPLYKVLTCAIEGVDLTYKDKINLLDLFTTCWEWYDKFYTIHDDLALVPYYEVIYFACGLLGCSEYENERIISKYESHLTDLVYALGTGSMLNFEFLDKIEEIINQPKTDINQTSNETE